MEAYMFQASGPNKRRKVILDKNGKEHILERKVGPDGGLILVLNPDEKGESFLGDDSSLISDYYSIVEALFEKIKSVEGFYSKMESFRKAYGLVLNS